MLPPDRFDLAALLRAAVLPATPGTAELSMLRDRSWPGGGDRSIPHAHDWLRRWGPRRTVAAFPVCECARGRCTVCN